MQKRRAFADANCTCFLKVCGRENKKQALFNVLVHIITLLSKKSQTGPENLAGVAEGAGSI